MSKTPKTIEMEIAVADYFNPRVNLVIPNVSWGLLNHECDLLIMTKSGYLYEVEIKINRYDLIKDKDKPHKHKSRLIKKLFFAVPDSLIKYSEHIPDHAGIFVVYKSNYSSKWRVKRVREAKIANNHKVTAKEKYQIARLGALRIFGLKKKIVGLTNKINN